MRTDNLSHADKLGGEKGLRHILLGSTCGRTDSGVCFDPGGKLNSKLGKLTAEVIDKAVSKLTFAILVAAVMVNEGPRVSRPGRESPGRPALKIVSDPVLNEPCK